MNVNIYDVAKKSGLSVVTVSRVINNSPSVRDYNRDKVLRAMEELGYHPSSAARSLAKGKTGIIGLLLPGLNDDFFNNVVRAINARLIENGYFLAISLEDEGGGSSKASHYLFQEKRVDGIILLSPLMEDEYIIELKKRNIPFILLDNQKSQPSIFSVLVDNFKGGYMATRHLIKLGHRNIAFISGSDLYLSNRERKRGFLEALNESGMEPYSIDGGEFDADVGYNVTMKWIDSGRIPTAIFTADDNIMFGAFDAIKEKGFKIPGDISICGYDDDLLSSKLHPTLTTVRQPSEEMGRKAVEILMQLMSGKHMRSMTVKLEPQLILRDSTAAPQL